MDKLTLVLLDLIRAVGTRVPALLRQPGSSHHTGRRETAVPRAAAGVIAPVRTSVPDAAAGSFWNLDASYERLFTAVEARQFKGGERILTPGTPVVCSPMAKRRSTREQSFSVQH